MLFFIARNDCSETAQTQQQQKQIMEKIIRTSRYEKADAEQMLVNQTSSRIERQKRPVSIAMRFGIKRRMQKCPNLL